MPVSVNTVERGLNARIVEVPVSANMGKRSINARITEVSVSANMGHRSTNVPIVMVRLYVKLMDHRIIQDVEQQETEDWTGSALIALLIYSRMILGH